jgi:cephalosporin-C deacetylase
MAQFDLPLSQLVSYEPEVPPPADFDDFWKSTLASAGEHDLAATFTPHDALLSEVKVYDVRFSGYAGQPVAGWFLTPAADSGPRPCVVNFIGYGGGRGRPHEWLVWPAAGYSVLVMDSRGQGDGDTDDVPGVGVQHKGLITRGVLNRDDYYYRRLFTDAVRAVDAARALDVVDASRVAVLGQSQGGGTALAVAALVPDLAAVVAHVPFLCDFPRATVVTDAHPFREIADYLATHRHRREAVHETLAYFDGVNFARRAGVPARFSAALMDDIVPPSTVFAAYNVYAGPKQLDVWPYNGHEAGGADDDQAALAFLQSHLRPDAG